MPPCAELGEDPHRSALEERVRTGTGRPAPPRAETGRTPRQTPRTAARKNRTSRAGSGLPETSSAPQTLYGAAARTSWTRTRLRGEPTSIRQPHLTATTTATPSSEIRPRARQIEPGRGEARTSAGRANAPDPRRACLGLPHRARARKSAAPRRAAPSPARRARRSRHGCSPRPPRPPAPARRARRTRDGLSPRPPRPLAAPTTAAAPPCLSSAERPRAALTSREEKMEGPAAADAAGFARRRLPAAARGGEIWEGELVWWLGFRPCRPRGRRHERACAVAAGCNFWQGRDDSVLGGVQEVGSLSS